MFKPSNIIIIILISAITSILVSYFMRLATKEHFVDRSDTLITSGQYRGLTQGQLQQMQRQNFAARTGGSDAMYNSIVAGTFKKGSGAPTMPRPSVPNSSMVAPNAMPVPINH